MSVLEGIRVIEFGGIGPVPFAGMMLADHGAEVIRVDRPGAHGSMPGAPAGDLMMRSRRSMVLDMGKPGATEAMLDLVATADVFVEGFRPGVAERLGVGPEALLDRNPRLVYGHMTGWGREGPLAHRAGHDIDFVAVAGALGLMGRRQLPPSPPLNLVGDFGGGGMLLAFGVLAALVRRGLTGKGGVVDAAMVDGSALVTTLFHGMRHFGLWSDEREANLLDGGTPFYDCYETADGRFVAVGALEPQFYAELIAGLGLAAADLPAQYDRSAWPQLKEVFTECFLQRTMAEWDVVFAGTDACVAPVLNLADAALHPHLAARGTFVEVAGITQPAPAPRFDGDLPSTPTPPRRPGEDTRAILVELGYGAERIEEMAAAGALG